MAEREVGVGLSTACKPICEQLITQVGQTWAEALPFPLEFEFDSFQLLDRDSFLSSLGPHACFGRSLFCGPGKGIGGWILPEPITDLLTRGLLHLPPPPRDGAISFGGPINRGMKRLHQLFLNAWNGTAPPTWRLSEEATDAAVERVDQRQYRTLAAQIYPQVFAGTCVVSGRYSIVAFAISSQMFENPGEGYHPPTTVKSVAKAASSSIAIHDRDGAVVEWLLKEIQSGRLSCKSSDRTDSSPATLTVGGRPGQSAVESISIERHR